MTRFPRSRLVRSFSPETRGLARDSAYLGVGKAVTTAGMIAQVALISHALGIKAYGVFALAVSFVALVDRFFDVDVGRAAIAFGTRHVRADARTTAGIFQLSYVVDLLLGVMGFIVVAATAPFAGPALVGDEGLLIFLLYAVTLLVSTVDGTSGALLQLLGDYRSITGLTIVREVARVIAVAVAVVAFDSLVAVVALLVVQDALTGLAGVILASRSFARSTGTPLFAPALSMTHHMRRPMLGMIFQTNLIGYGRLVQSQVPALLLGVFHGPLEVGIFKIGMAGATAVGQLSTPAWNAVMPRLSRLWNDGRLQAMRHLVVQGSAVAFVLLAAGGMLAVVFSGTLLELFGGEQARAAKTVFALAVVAQVVNGTLFWNDGLLYAAGKASAVTKILLPSVAVLLVLTIVLGDRWGANGAAAAILVSSLLTAVGLTIAAARLLRRDHAAAPAVAA